MILIIWSSFWFAYYNPENSFIKNITNKSFGDIFNSVNALFAGLGTIGIIITLINQLSDSEEISKSVIATGTEAKEKAILDLYQTFSTEYFQQVKSSSHKVMISAVKNKDYCDFMISRFFVISEDVDDEIDYINIDYTKVTDSEKNRISFNKEEQIDRFKLDELINFFTLLSNKSSSKEIIKSCDFFYDWWRPLFWLIAIRQLEYYATLSKEHKDLKHYCKKPKFINVVKKLDEIYEYESFNDKNNYIMFWDYFLNHPKIKSYKIDKRYKEYNK